MFLYFHLYLHSREHPRTRPSQKASKAQMGAGESTAVVAAPTLDALPPEMQRCLFLSVEMMARRDAATPGRFSLAAFREVHASMPAELSEALWRALCLGAQASVDATLDLNAVVRTIVPLRVGGNRVLEARKHLEACFENDVERGVMVAFEEAVPWLEAMQELPLRPASRSLAAAEAILAAAACAAWLLDLRELEPLPLLAESSRLLTKVDVRLLSAQLTLEQRRRWRLLFSSARDGTSFTRFIALGARRAPCLVVVREEALPPSVVPGMPPCPNAACSIFGGFSSKPLQPSPQFGGDYGSFLFKLGTAPEVFRSSGKNSNFVYLNAGMDLLPNGLAFGANGSLDDRFFGLWLRDDLETGRSDAPCATFGDSPCLALAAEFRVAEVELWAVAEDPPPPSDEEQAAGRGENALTAVGVLSSKHEETRKFLEIATGKGQASADLGVTKE